MSEIQVAVMRIGNEKYGSNIQQILSIERMMDMTKVPNTLPFVKGIIHLRGNITPIIDLRERFHLSIGHSDESRIVVVQVKDTVVGMIVDDVTDVLTVSDKQIDAPPAVIGGVSSKYLQGVAKIADQLLVLLDLEQILSDVESRQIAEVEKSVG